MQVVRRIVVTLHCIFQRFEIALNLVHKDLRRMIRVSLLQVHNAFHSFAQVTYFVRAFTIKAIHVCSTTFNLSDRKSVV